MYQFCFKSVISFSFTNFDFRKTSSSIKYGLVSIGYSLLIGLISVAILPLIKDFTTAIYFFPSWDDLKLSIIPVLKSALFLVGSYTKTMAPLVHISKPFLFLRLKCSDHCNKYSLFQRFLKLSKILLK